MQCEICMGIITREGVLVQLMIYTTKKFAKIARAAELFIYYIHDYSYPPGIDIT